jgi:hypothetical protein
LKAVLGVVSLLVALAIVASVARKQLQSGVVAGATAADPGLSVPSQAKSLEEKARSDVSRALQEGAQRNESADR